MDQCSMNGRLSELDKEDNAERKHNPGCTYEDSKRSFSEYRQAPNRAMALAHQCESNSWHQEHQKQDDAVQSRRDHEARFRIA